MSCMVLLMVEFLVRAIVHPRKLKMLLSPLFYFDLINLLPYLIYLIGSQNTTIQHMMLVVSIFRAFLLFKFFRHLEMLRMLSDTLKKSYKEIMIYVVYLVLGVLVFSTFIYYIEQSNDGTIFYSIPAAFWYFIFNFKIFFIFFQNWS